MHLWVAWWNIVKQLRGTCSRVRTFLWLGVVLVGFTIRGDLLGVTSIIRALGLLECSYDRLLDFFHSRALSIQKLTQTWIHIVVKYLPLLRRNGRIVLVGDGIKIPKAGKKMPAVKKLFQESESNTKPQYIFGHSYQAVAILAGVMPSIFAVPLISRIHDGIVLSNRDLRTYHFWMRNMKPQKRKRKNQHLHRDTEKYREAVLRKVDAYHRFVQIGIIGQQGLLQYLACCHAKLVWNSFGSWIRTIRPGA